MRDFWNWRGWLWLAWLCAGVAATSLRAAESGGSSQLELPPCFASNMVLPTPRAAEAGDAVVFWGWTGLDETVEVVFPGASGEPVKGLKEKYPKGVARWEIRVSHLGKARVSLPADGLQPWTITVRSGGKGIATRTLTLTNVLVGPWVAVAAPEQFVPRLPAGVNASGVRVLWVNGLGWDVAAPSSSGSVFPGVWEVPATDPAPAGGPSPAAALVVEELARSGRPVGVILVRQPVGRRPEKPFQGEREETDSVLGQACRQAMARLEAEYLERLKRYREDMIVRKREGLIGPPAPARPPAVRSRVIGESPSVQAQVAPRVRLSGIAW